MRYRESEVRLVQILVADEAFEAPTNEYCNAWVARFGLTNVALIDPTHMSNVYFPTNALPSQIVIDNSTGEIVFRGVGVTEGLTTLRARLDELLAE